jgi:hypothetical protein
MIPHDRGRPPRRERPAGQGRVGHLENGTNKPDNNATPHIAQQRWASAHQITATVIPRAAANWVMSGAPIDLRDARFRRDVVRLPRVLDGARDDRGEP